MLMKIYVADFLCLIKITNCRPGDCILQFDIIVRFQYHLLKLLHSSVRILSYFHAQCFEKII